jgi:hypothetical protein
MSYFNDKTFLTNNIQINGKSMPMTSEPVSVTFQNISTGGRLADNIDYEGELSGTKVTIKLTYAILNKEHYDVVFNATQQAYLNKNGFFMEITVPTYTPLGFQTYKGYFMSEHTPACTQTTEREYYRTGDSRYNIGGSLYDELHEDVEFSFVQK